MVGGRLREGFWVAIVGVGPGFVVAVADVEEGVVVVGSAILLVALWVADLLLGLFGET